jgi:hypothetical protein
MDGEAQAASSERRPWLADANVRRWGTGDPEATFVPDPLDALLVACL